MESKHYIEFKKRRELGEILSDSFGFVRNEFRPLFGAILKIVGPFLVAMLLSLVFYMYTVGDSFNLGLVNSDVDDFSPLLMFIAILALFASYMASYILAQGTVLHYVKSYIENRGTANFTTVRSRVYRSYWALLGLGLLVGITLFMGALLCFLPAIYLVVPLSLSFAILIFLEKTISDSFRYSFTLIKRNWWATFATLLVVYIIVVIASYAFGLPGVLYLWAKMGVFSGEMDAENSNIFKDPLYLLLNMMASIVQFLMHTILLVATTFIFFNLNERKNFTGTMERIENLGKSKEK